MSYVDLICPSFFLMINSSILIVLIVITTWQLHDEILGFLETSFSLLCTTQAKFGGTAWPGQAGSCWKSFPLIDDLPDSGMIDVYLFGNIFKSLPICIDISNLLSEGLRDLF